MLPSQFYSQTHERMAIPLVSKERKLRLKATHFLHQRPLYFPHLTLCTFCTNVSYLS